MGLGAVGVLSTLWPVDDLATAFLVARFYDLHLAGGEAPPSALRHAQAWLSRATENDLIGYAEAMLAKPGFEAAPIVRIVKSMLRHTMDDESRGAREKPFHEEVVLPVTRGLLGRILARMRNDKAERRPFEHPYYWAGFIYAGQ
jgi:CHAT domain-containing protein